MHHFVFDKIDKNSNDIVSEIKYKYTKQIEAPTSKVNTFMDEDNCNNLSCNDYCLDL